MSPLCDHEDTVETGEAVVCVSCGLVLHSLYLPSHHHQDDWKREDAGLEELKSLLEEVCARCHISFCIQDRAIRHLKTAKEKNLLPKGHHHSALI